VPVAGVEAPVAMGFALGQAVPRGRVVGVAVGVALAGRGGRRRLGGRGGGLRLRLGGGRRGRGGQGGDRGGGRRGLLGAGRGLGCLARGGLVHVLLDRHLGLGGLDLDDGRGGVLSSGGGRRRLGGARGRILGRHGAQDVVLGCGGRQVVDDEDREGGDGDREREGEPAALHPGGRGDLGRVRDLGQRRRRPSGGPPGQVPRPGSAGAGDGARVRSGG